MEWKRLLWLAGMVLPTVPAFLCVAACPLNTISKNLLLIKSRGTSWNMFCLEAITSYPITLAASSATEAEFHFTFFTLMIYNAVGDVIIHFISLRSSIRNAMTWWLGYILHTVTLLQHVKLPSLFHVKTTWQRLLVYWKSAFYVIKIPALTQLDSSSKSVSDVLCDFICRFFTLWSFICFTCVPRWLWSFCMVYLRFLSCNFTFMKRKSRQSGANGIFLRIMSVAANMLLTSWDGKLFSKHRCQSVLNHTRGFSSFLMP